MKHPARLYVFDMMAAGARDLRQLPLVERQQHLRNAFDDTGVLICTQGIVTAGEWVFEQVKARDLEGMVAKGLDSNQQRGRSRDSLKTKWGGHSRSAARVWTQ